MTNNPRDVEFGRIAISLKLVEPDELSEWLQEYKEVPEGKYVDMGEWLREKEYLSKKEVLKIQKQMITLSGIHRSAKEELLSKIPSDLDTLPAPMEDEIAKEMQKLEEEEKLAQETEQKPQAASETSLKSKGLKPGSKIDHYEIVSEIGRGGMGRVYKVYDTQKKVHIALKLLTSDPDNQVSIARFFREAILSAKLNHPNLIAVYNVSDLGERFYFTMELVEGTTLERVLKAGSLSREKILDIMIKTAQALQYAHGKKIIHRDLKPSNVMIDKNDQPKLMDFGLAKIVHEVSKLTQPGMVMGTAQYMSPEQADGRIHEVDEQSDLYSLGAILYELLTGRPPFTGKSFTQLIDHVLHSEPDPPSKVKSSVDKEMENICLKALEKKKESRYKNAAQMAEDLILVSQNKIAKGASGNFQRQILRKLTPEKLLLIAVLGLFVLIPIVISQRIKTPKTMKTISKTFQFKLALVNQEKKVQQQFSKGDSIQLKLNWNARAKKLSTSAKLSISGENIAKIDRSYSQKNPLKVPLYIPLTLTKKDGKFKLLVSLQVGEKKISQNIEWQVSK